MSGNKDHLRDTAAEELKSYLGSSKEYKELVFDILNADNPDTAEVHIVKYLFKLNPRGERKSALKSKIDEMKKNKEYNTENLMELLKYYDSAGSSGSLQELRKLVFTPSDKATIQSN